MSSAAMRDRCREARAARLNAAFTAWLMGAGERRTWGQFCSHYGLTEEAAKKPEKVDTKSLYEKADRIVERVLQNRCKK
jgi:hypothetical protein